MKHVWCLSIWWMVPGPWQMINASPMVIMSLTKQTIPFYLIISATLFSIISYNCSSCITFWSYERQLLLWHYNSCHLRAYYVRANTLCFTWLNSFNPHNSPLRWDLLLPPFYRQENWSTEIFSKLPKVTQVVSDVAGFLVQVIWVGNSYAIHCCISYTISFSISQTSRKMICISLATAMLQQ